MAAPYLSEIKYLGGGSLDFIEVALDNGTNPANVSVIVYHPTGAVRTTNALGTLQSSIAGTDVYTIDAASSATFNGLHQNGAVALVVGGVVTAFYSFNATVTATGGPASGMTSTVIGTTGAGQSLESVNGTTYTVTSTPNAGVVPCFVTGCEIDTPSGPCPVERLQAGDLVMTKDAGAQPLLWTGTRRLSRRERDDAQAVLIPANTFGPGMPARSVSVSPNHRVLLNAPELELLYCANEVLIAAKYLAGWRGIRTVPLARGLSFHHLLLREHHVLGTSGLESESLHLSELALVGFEPRVRRAIWARFGDLPMQNSARMILSKHEARTALSYVSPQSEMFLMAA